MGRRATTGAFNGISAACALPIAAEKKAESNNILFIMFLIGVGATPLAAWSLAKALQSPLFKATELQPAISPAEVAGPGWSTRLFAAPTSPASAP
jgi:hypothetical protein